MTGDCHVPFCGSPGLRCPGLPDRFGGRPRLGGTPVLDEPVTAGSHATGGGPVPPHVA
jgi:hypothetical protein